MLRAPKHVNPALEYIRYIVYTVQAQLALVVRAANETGDSAVNLQPVHYVVDPEGYGITPRSLKFKKTGKRLECTEFVKLTDLRMRIRMFVPWA